MHNDTMTSHALMFVISFVQFMFSLLMENTRNDANIQNLFIWGLETHVYESREQHLLANS